MEIDYRLIRKELKLKKSRLRRNGTELASCCASPDHEDNDPSFSINLESQKYHCYSCGFKGEGLRSLYTKLGVRIPEWMEKISGAGRPKARRKSVKKKKEVEIRDTWIKILTANKQGAVKVLGRRKIEAKTVAKFKVGYNARKNALIFPIFDYEGHLSGWTERSDDLATRYQILPANVDKGDLLYGSWLIREGKPNTVYLVEGPVDALRLWGWGYKAVAILGNDVMEQQADAIVALAKVVIIVPDNDRGGMKFITSAMRSLRNRVSLFGVELPSSVEDVGDSKLTKVMFERCLKKRTPIHGK